MTPPKPDRPDREPPSLRRGFPLVFWLALAFSALCIAAGAAVAWLGPHYGELAPHAGSAKQAPRSAPGGGPGPP